MGLMDAVKGKKSTEFYFFSGKGGVGKTSMAAATALWFAKKGKKTLIVSTDPAHSLSDSFEEKVGGDIKEMGKNLYALEIDPKKSLNEYKEKLMPQIEKMGFLKGLGLEDTVDITSMTPGIDEVASFDKFLNYMNSDEYDIIVFDTAPTGHALRFLSLPDILDSWVGKIINIQMKFSGVIDTFKKFLPFGEDNKEGAEKMGTEQLEAMREKIAKAKEILSDKKRTHYRIVMIPEAMSIFESERSIEVLNEYKIPVDAVIVNQLIPHSDKCDFCAGKHKLQQKRLGTIKEKFNDRSILQMSLFKEEVKGLDMLEIVGKKLYGA